MRPVATHPRPGAPRRDEQHGGEDEGGEWDKITKACGVEDTVPVMVVWGRQQDVETAAREIVIRAQDATRGVPSETRQALDDGTDGFERILPGADRMYPDTDLPPIRIDRGLDRIADFEHALAHCAEVGVVDARQLDRVVDIEVGRCRSESARVADLAAGFGVKRGLVEQYDGLAARLQRIDLLAAVEPLGRTRCLARCLAQVFVHAR